MKFIFIGGSGRSGTTFVQKLLLIHSKIAGGDEFDFLPQLMAVYKSMASESQVHDRQKLFYTEEYLNGAWRTFIESLFLPTFNAKNGVQYISEKTPDNIFEAAALLDLFPDAKFIFVYRDARDVINSFLQVAKRYNKENKKLSKENVAVKYANNWMHTIDMHTSLSLNPKYKERVYALKYEALLTEPVEEITRLMSFIGVPVETTQFSPSKFEAGELNMLIDNLWYDKKMFNQDFNTSNIGKWKKEMSFFNKFIVNSLLARRLKDFGYEIGPNYLFLNSIIRRCIRLMYRIQRSLK